MKFFTSLLLLAATLTPAAAALNRGPYLQNSTPDSIVLRWRTSTLENSRVNYGTNFAGLNLTNNDAATVTNHIVTLTGLAADTKYFYSIGSYATVLVGPSTNHFFFTHPLSGTPKPLRVWIIGDAGTATTSQINVRNAFETYNGNHTLNAWLQLGDNAYNKGLDSEYQTAVFNIYTNELRNCVTWSTLGNHETGQTNTNIHLDNYPYFDIFTLPTAGEAGGVPSTTKHYYSFDLGMVHFICLDSMTVDRSTNAAMAIWLRSDLAVTTNRWLIAFWHHPPYSRGSHDSDKGGVSYDTQMGEMRTNFLPILENGGVDLVFCGHSHAFERSKLLNGHYGLSGTFNATTNVMQVGSGRETNGVGAYHKPDGLGEHPVGNRGTIYTVAGSSGQATSGLTNHPVMYYSALALGSVVLDFNSNRLDAVFLRDTGATNDFFSIVKDGTYPPQLTSLTPLPGGDVQFTVLTRGYRTNLIEASPDLDGSPWTTLGTNTTPNTSFSFTDTNALAKERQFYRVQRR